MKRRASVLLALLVAVCLSLTACDFDVYDLPLPGGADTGKNPMTLHVEFADVLDLVPDSAVKVDEVSVGKVKTVELVDGHADVTLEVRRDTKLPADTTAQIRQTSLLGEKFVSLVAPASSTNPALLRSGDTIPLERSGRNPEVEEVLGALSLVLNGGGVAQLKTISTELNKALAGHEDSARSVLTQVAVLMKSLDDDKASIVQALESIDRLSKSVRSQERTIDAALDELPGALKSIDAQRKDLVTMLQALSRLGDVGVRVINASKTATIQVVENLEPTLTQLAAAGDSLVNSFDTVLTYPFVDEAVGRDPQVARNLHMGDYVNLSIDLQADLSGLSQGGTDVGTAVSTLQSCLQEAVKTKILTGPACRALSPQELLNVKSNCHDGDYAKKHPALCSLLNQVPDPPGVGQATALLQALLDQLLPSGGAGTGTGGDGSGGGTGGTGGGSAGNPLCTLIGLCRSAPGGEAGAGARAGRSAYTYQQLSGLYDPTLVRLLVPGLDTEGGAR